MQGCFVEFSSPDESSLLRTIACVNHVAALKRDDALDEKQMAQELSASERAFFWEPNPEELQEWNAFWFSTPLPQRHSPNMPTPGWSFGSMVESIASAEFDITGVATEGSKCYLTFEPESYPFGGVGCLVALLECLGNQVSAVNDGTGVLPHAQSVRWTPRRGK
ncbi:hypothetical protein [Pelomonas sp. Root1237]|uniref:hypothetical protein n=1 Tax=Pelomonas sp. Root1237 TaxID=1736434 RepID=UPI0007013024|nr:hypothetical protein [Pelomonas sp. Root1237]KQV88051.1 hypothetical protein ASC91_14415 [Pelomonas sp. Root1237]